MGLSMTLNEKSSQILLLGYGEMGHAFAALLSQRHSVAIWSRQREQQGLCLLDAEVTKADIIIFCLPVTAHEAVIQRLSKSIPAHTICITIAKGLDEAGNPAFLLLEKHLPSQSIGALYGPMIAEELIDNHPGFAQLVCSDDNSYEQVARCFQHSHLFIERSDDLIGTSWSVILKNVYALLLGMSDGLGLGDNMRGYLMVKALQELSDLVHVLGGNPLTPYHLAGLGDLVTTATSRNSHHHELGLAIGEGREIDLTGEGVHTIKMVETYRPFDHKAYPLFALCSSIIQHTAQCREYFSAYLNSQNETSLK